MTSALVPGQQAFISERDMLRIRQQFEALAAVVATQQRLRVRSVDDVLADLERRAAQNGIPGDQFAALVADLAPHVGPGAAEGIYPNQERLAELYRLGATHRHDLSYSEAQQLAHEINSKLMPDLDARPVIDTTAVTLPDEPRTAPPGWTWTGTDWERVNA